MAQNDQPDGIPSPLDHEYQLLLSTDAGRLALDRYTAFLAAHASDTIAATRH